MNNENFGYNYHTHTYRCGHAVGTEFEMAETAYIHGYKILGISDHVFLPGISQPRVRGDYACYVEYISNLKMIKEQYEGKMKVYSAFECEDYGETFFSYYLGILESGDCDYLILGQHCRLAPDHHSLWWYGAYDDPHVAVRTYTEDIIHGMESGLYIYVCHPDLFMRYIGTWDEVCEECAKRIISKAVELDLPLEVNMTPSRSEYRLDENGNRIFSYPNDRFWTLASQMKATTILGVDAHDPKHLYQTEFNEFRKFIERHDLHPIEELDIESYRKKLFARYSLTKKTN